MSNIRDFFPVVDFCGYVTGDVAMFAMETPPEGFVECNGATLPVNDYKGLHNVIGYHYGGSGDYFQVPDYQGVFLKGAYSSTNVYQSDLLEYHQHGIPMDDVNQGISVTGNEDPDSGLPTHFALGSYGGVETRPENVYILFAIKL